MNGQYILLKYFREKDYADAFIAGKLYMNSLGYFWNEYPLIEAKRKLEEYLKSHPGSTAEDANIIPEYANLNPDQADPFEGTVGTAPDDQIKSDFGDGALSDVIYRAIGYQYCNVLCFYRLDYRFDGLKIECDYNDMDDFGDL